MSQTTSDELEKKLPLIKRISKMEISEKIRMALTGDKEARCLLARGGNKLVLSYVLQNPRITEQEILALANVKDLPKEIIATLYNKKQWMKKYPIRLALAKNPKLPLAYSMKLLNTLRDADLRKIAKSRDVAANVATGARRILMRRGLL